MSAEGSTPEERLASLGLSVPEVAKPVAAYIPAVRSGNHVFTSGQLPMREGQLITTGKVYLAQPPLYRIDIGKETFWALDDRHKDDLLKKHAKGRANPEITRFKGLGEMMPKVLWETTLNPRTRRLLRVQIADLIVTDRVINELMGKDASARFRFIMERAEEARELDL